MKSKLIGWLTVVTLVVSMVSVGVSFTGGTRAEAAEKIEIVFWHVVRDMSSPTGEWLLETADEYQKKYPNVELILENVPECEMSVMLQTAAAAHRGADAISYWEGEYLFPLREHMRDNKKYFSPEELAGFMPSVMITGYYNYDKSKRLFGVPDPIYGFGFYHMIYNKAMFRKAGVPVPTEATDYRMSWDEFTDACDKLKAAGITPLGWGNEGGYASCWWWASYLLQTFEKGDYVRLYKGEIPWNDPKIVKAFSRINELYQAGYYNEGGLTLGWTEGLNLVRNREVAMQTMYWGPNNRETYEELGDDYGMMKDPVFNPDGPLTYTLMGGGPSKYLIPTWSEYPEEAAKWIKFFTSKEKLDKLYQMSGIFPPRVDFDTSLIKNRWDKLAWGWITEKPLSPNYDNVATPIEIYYEQGKLSVEMCMGKITPQELCDRLQERFEQLDYPWITGR